MRKFLLVAACAFCALTVSAQRASSSSSTFFSTEKVEGGVQFGIRAGLNSSNMAFSSDGNTLTVKSRTSFHVGLIADIPVVESFYIQTGLYYQNKGWKQEYSGVESNYKPMYLEIPLLASYRYNFSDAAQLQINFGPYFAYGIGGKEKYDYGYDEDDYECDFFGDDGDWNRFDMGLQVGAGVTFAQHYYIGFAYEFGLTNIADIDDDDDYSYKNRNWMISLGYNF